MTVRTRRGWRTALRISERVFALIGISALIYHSCFGLSIVTSGSMAPALRGNDVLSGDRVLFETLTGRFRKPRRWEIHRFETNDGITVAKRIVGLPGERISLHGRALQIDGKPIPFPPELAHLHYYDYGNLAGGKEVACAAGYFVLGDSSADSMDSRYEGVIAGDRFHGRAIFIVSPGEHRGFVR